MRLWEQVGRRCSGSLFGNRLEMLGRGSRKSAQNGNMHGFIYSILNQEPLIKRLGAVVVSRPYCQSEPFSIKLPAMLLAAFLANLSKLMWRYQRLLQERTELSCFLLRAFRFQNALVHVRKHRTTLVPNALRASSALGLVDAV
jgi:hypothetical protein